MNRYRRPTTSLLTRLGSGVVSSVLAMANAAAAEDAPVLSLSQSIGLPSVTGRLDHLAIDAESARLVVVALAANSVEVVDLRAGKRVARLKGLHEPQGVVYLHESRRLLVANGAGGGVTAFVDGKPPPVASAGELDDADNLRFDETEGWLYAGYGHALAIVNPTSMRVSNRIDLAGHPEAFELERAGRRIYVNVPGAHQIAVIDRDSGRATAAWDIEGGGQNFAMALDEPRQRLLVATRRPARLLVYDTRTGKRTSRNPLCDDADDLFLDARRHQLYAVCGQGVIQVLRRRDVDHYELVQTVPTSPGARTGLFVAALSTIFVAVPAVGGAAAEVRAYTVK